MVLRSATQEEIIYWDMYSGDNFLQSSIFAQIKSPSWKALYLIDEASEIKLLILTRIVPFLGTVAYIPGGPNIPSVESFHKLATSIKLFLKIHHPDIFLIKFEPRIAGAKQSDFLKNGLVQAPSIQPNATIVLPVTTDLTQMGRRARRYIRTGEREGVTVKNVKLSEKNMHTMYNLMGSAYGGRGIPGLRTFAYYKKFWSLFHEANAGDLYFAYDNNTPVAGVFVVKNGKIALYKDGGSLHGRQSKGATYLIHWKIMQDLAADKYTFYDLWGSPPSSQIGAPAHPLAGLASFKTAFSTVVTDYPGVFDSIVNQRKYCLWQLAYPLLRRFLLMVKKEGFY